MAPAWRQSVAMPVRRAGPEADIGMPEIANALRSVFDRLFPAFILAGSAWFIDAQADKYQPNFRLEQVQGVSGTIAYFIDLPPLPPRGQSRQAGTRRPGVVLMERPHTRFQLLAWQSNAMTPGTPIQLEVVDGFGAGEMRVVGMAIDGQPVVTAVELWHGDHDRERSYRRYAWLFAAGALLWSGWVAWSERARIRRLVQRIRDLY